MRHKAQVQSKSRRGKLFSDMSWAPSAAVNKMAHGVRLFTAPEVLRTINPVDGGQNTMPPYVLTKHHSVSAVAPLDQAISTPCPTPYTHALDMDMQLVEGTAPAHRDSTQGRPFTTP